MGWIDANVTASDSNTSSNSNTYGTRTPSLSQNYTDAYGNLTGNVNSAGANAPQQQALDWQTGNLLNNPVNGATTTANNALLTGGQGYASLNQGVLGGISNQAAPQAATTLANTAQATGAQAQGAQAAAAPLVGTGTGADAALAYAPLYSQALINPSLNAYDYGTDRAFSALDARTAGAGGFANSRSGLGYSDLGAQQALGRGQLESGLLTTGLTNAINFGQQDQNRSLLGQTTNAGNILTNNTNNAALLQQNNQNNASLAQNNSQFNTTAANQGSQFNATAANQGSQFNVGAQQTNTNQKLAATQQMAANLSSQLGINQQVLNNVVTDNGINTTAAQNLFTAGAITQSQLNDILSAAAAGNGYTYSQDTSGNSNTLGVTAKAGFG